MQRTAHARIAPTPSGFLHTGNAFNFLLTAHLAADFCATLRLRIDDLDAARSRDAFLADIFANLRWLGITPDYGPRDSTEQQAAFSQMLRLNEYSASLEKLRATGLVFACSCSRKELQAHNDNGQYNGTCLHKSIPLDTPDVAWRIQTPRPDTIIDFEDGIMAAQTVNLWDTNRHFIIRRRDGLPAYHVASLCDDIGYDINVIVRGADLLFSTAAQLYLAALLRQEEFSAKTRFYHHPLISDANGNKLSKSAGAASLKSLREAGFNAGKLRSEATAWWQNFL